jgi:DNA-binding NarL/FixJ family response regulator
MGESILLIDSTRALTNSIKVALELEGIRVQVASTYEQAVKLCAVSQFGIIICTYQFAIPGEHCIIDYCQRSNTLYKTPIIIVTEKLSEQEWVPLITSGAADIIAQPFSNKTLVPRIRKVAQQRDRYRKLFRDEVNQQVFALINKNFNQELLTPINGITNAIALSRAFVDDSYDDSLTDVFQVIEHSCFRMTRNLHNTRLFAQFQTVLPTHLAEQHHVIDFDTMLHSILSHYSFHDGSNPAIAYSVVDTGAFAGVEELTRIALTELIDNAVKFNHGPANPELHLQALEHGFTFEVSNSVNSKPKFDIGGIAPFKKFHSDISHNGLGLGLFVAKSICTLLGYQFHMVVQRQKVTFTVTGEQIH